MRDARRSDDVIDHAVPGFAAAVEHARAHEAGSAGPRACLRAARER